MHWKVSVGLKSLKCVRTSRIDSFLNLSSLNMHVSRKVVFVSGDSAVNVMVGWWLFAGSMTFVYISFLSIFRNQNISSINLFHTFLKWFIWASSANFCLHFSHEDVCKCNCHLCSHRRSLYLRRYLG